MDARIRRDLPRQVNTSPRTAALLLAAAQRLVGPVAAVTPADTGRTRATTRAEGGHRSADGRSVAARVVQGGAGVAQQFGNSRVPRPARQFNRALGS